jgi:hypothetical protein
MEKLYRPNGSHDPASAKSKTQTTTGAEVSSEVVISEPLQP